MKARAVFIPFVPDSAWTERVLPGLSPAEIPVAGRQFVDYAMEAAKRFSISKAEVVDWRFSSALQKRFAGPRDGVVELAARRGEGTPPRGLADLGALPGFRERPDEDLIVLWGVCLPFYDPSAARYQPASEEIVRSTPPGIYHRAGGRWLVPEGETLAVTDTASWLALSMDLLAGRGAYTLPGYSAEKGVSICRNVVMEHGISVKPPVLFCDNSWCGRNVRLENVVVGENAYVGERARLTRTVVCDGTMVGDGLELDGKIVIGNRVVDAGTGTWADVEEPGVVGGVARAPAWLRAVGRFLAGASRGRRA